MEKDTRLPVTPSTWRLLLPLLPLLQVVATLVALLHLALTMIGDLDGKLQR